MVMGFLLRLLVCIGLSLGLSLLLMVAMYEPEAPPATASLVVTATAPSGAPGMSGGSR